MKLLTKNDLTGSVVWTLTKDGANQPLASFTNDGGTVIFPEPGEYTLTATLRDSNGKTATASQSITIIFKAALTVTAPDSIHIGTKFPVGISGAGSLPVSWGVKLGGRPVTLDSNTGFLSNDGGTLALYAEGTYTITATVRDDAGNLTSGFTNITVTNTAPVIELYRQRHPEHEGWPILCRSQRRGLRPGRGRCASGMEQRVPAGRLL